MFPVMPVAHLPSAMNGQCTIGDFTLLNGALIMAEEQDRDRLVLPDLMERRHRRFRFSSARTGATPDRRASAGAVFQGPPGATQIEDRAGEHLRQRLDRNERDDFERRHDRRKLGRRGGIGGYRKRRTEYVVAGNPAVDRQEI